MPTRSRAPRYQLGRGEDPTSTAQTPTWVIAVVRLGQPLSYSRRTQRSIGKVVEGAFTRKAEPLVIIDDCVSLRITDSKRSHTKSLEAQLRGTGTNYIDSDVMLPGDWLFAWIHDYPDDVPELIQRIKRGDACNDWRDGLKFVGRVHSINKTIDQQPGGHRSQTFDLQGVGFAELDTQFFYDFALATASGNDRFSTFMAQLGLDFTNWTGQQLTQVEKLKDNGANLILALIDIIVGRGASDVVNRPLERAQAAVGGGIVKGQVVSGAPQLKIAPQANKEAPAAYLVPAQVAGILGAAGPSKAGIHGYADILQLLIGMQAYTPDANAEIPTDFQPVLKEGSTFNRKLCRETLKGTFLPVNPSFVNRPLWQLLQQYLNSAINEMYTTLRVDETGRVRPTLVVRQIPFSTESVEEDKALPLTRFLSLPRWVVPDVLATNFRIGRSDATRCNYLHVYGEAFYAASNEPISKQLVRNAPIVDELDVQRSGIRAQMTTVNCALFDQKRTDGARTWMAAIADWAFGMQYTLQGSLTLYGIQAPICVGDNLEFEGVAYHIESLTHHAMIGPDGQRTWRTSVELSNGMPVDQDDANADVPRYPGFRIKSVTKKRQRQVEVREGDILLESTTAVTQTDSSGDAEVGASLDPGVSLDSIYKP